eukprot:gene10664-11828_t
MTSTTNTSPSSHQLSSTGKAFQPFVVGGASAMLSSSCVHPIDLAKVRLQLFATINPTLPKPSFVRIIQNMIATEGFFSIYTGLSAALMRQAVYGTARIGLHRKISNDLLAANNGQPLSFGMKTMSGMISGSIAVCIGTPFDVTLVRMQGDSMKPIEQRRGYKNVFHALKRVVQEEGFAKLYSGLMPNVLRGMAMNVGMLACYDQALEMIATYITHEDLRAKPSILTQILASVTAGGTASAFSLPFDLLKSRLQDGQRYRGLSDAFFQILRKEGVLAFWTGLGAYYLRTAPHAMIVLMSQEPITQLYYYLFGKP